MPGDFEKIIDLSLGETELLPPLAISSIARAAYSNDGLEAHHVERLSRLLGLEMSSRDIILTAGASQGLLTAVLFSIRKMSQRPTQLVTFSPYYPGYKSIADLAGLNLVTIPIAEWLREGDAILDGTNMEKSILLMNSPHNPTGIALSRGVLTRLAHRANEAGSFLIWDAAYLGVASEPGPISPLPAGTLLVGSFSKLLGLAGERVGFVLGAPNMTEGLRRAQWGLALSAPATGVTMARARLDTLTPRHFAKCRSQIASNRAALSIFLWGDQGQKEPSAGPFMWVEHALAKSDWIHRLVAKNIKIAPGSAFGACETAFRINLMVQPAKTRAMIERLGS